jgi:NAD(P)-dependent dehydrogenase (short-subunit alcohol dehydrogenase family)
MRKKVVIVTGAGKGIGKAVALAFAQKKFQVVVAEIDTESGQKTADEISDLGELALFIKTDVSTVADIQTMVANTIENFGRIDVLVNNAGLSEFFDPMEMDETTWDRIIDTNLKSVFFASREVALAMKEKGGSIINIASTRALMSEPNSEAYAASKGGIVALTHALAASFSKYRIMVNAILPGWIETSDYAALNTADHVQHLSQRVGKPSDIANACLFLANKENDFITGTQLVIDGGMTRKMIYE